MKKKSDIREMVLTALFTAIIIIMAFVPMLGYINLVVIKATLIHVPVIIGSIVYKACVSIALLLNDLHIGGLDISIPVTASDLKLITSVLFLIILVVSPSGGKKVKSHA